MVQHTFTFNLKLEKFESKTIVRKLQHGNALKPIYVIISSAVMLEIPKPFFCVMMVDDGLYFLRNFCAKCAKMFAQNVQNFPYFCQSLTYSDKGDTAGLKIYS